MTQTNTIQGSITYLSTYESTKTMYTGNPKLKFSKASVTSSIETFVDINQAFILSGNFREAGRETRYVASFIGRFVPFFLARVQLGCHSFHSTMMEFKGLLFMMDGEIASIRVTLLHY